MIKELEVEDLKQKLDRPDYKDEIVLIDCREQEEWDAGHIKQAQFLPLSKFEDEVKKAEESGLINKEKTLILQCRSGKRSMTACEYLESRGYNDLYNLEGGILAWQDEGFEIEA